MNVIKASVLLEADKKAGFARLISGAYAATDWLYEDYPAHFEHYFGKYVPGIFSGEHEIIACRAGGEIVAVAILKRLWLKRKSAQSM